MKKINLVLLLFLGALPNTPDAQVRDVRGYEIRESRYLGRPGGIQQDIYWLDNDRVIFIGAKPDDFVEPIAGLKELRYGLYVWNLSTGIVDRHYGKDIANGNLCVFQRYVRLSYTSDYQRGPVNQNWYSFHGLFGEEEVVRFDQRMREEQRNHERMVNRFTCREYKGSELPTLGYQVTPLLEGEFVSKDQKQRLSEVVHWKYWPLAGAPILLNMTHEVIGVGRYSAFLDGYVLYEGPRGVEFSDTVVRRSWLMDRKGSIRDFTPPSGPWMRGSTIVAPTKRGLFLLSHAVYSGGNGAAGGYLVLGGEPQRVIAGLPTSFDVSADGCRVALAISQWSRDKPVTPWLKVVNLCTREG